MADSTSALVLERLELGMTVAPLTPWLLAGALDRGARPAAICLPPLSRSWRMTTARFKRDSTHFASRWQDIGRPERLGALGTRWT